MAAGPPLGGLVRLALWLGIAGFGGGFSVLAQMRRDLVDRRRWVEAESFFEMLEVAKVLPGTSATNLFTLIGEREHGTAAGVLLGATFLLPSAATMVLLGALYPVIRRMPDMGAFLDGLGVAMVPIVGAVVYEIGKDALRSLADVGLALLCCAAMAWAGIGLLELALAAAALGAGTAIWQEQSRARAARIARPPARHGGEGPPPAAGVALFPWMKAALVGAGLATLPSLAHVFAKIGAATFGGGLVMIPAIEQQVVHLRHWLTPAEFSDAIAFGQITPGPVAISATFIGYRVAGLSGALASTVAMFAPPMAMTLLAGRGLGEFRQSPVLRGAIRTLGPAVIGMLLAAMVSLARVSVASPVSILIVAAGLLVLMVFRVNPLWVLLGGGLATLGASGISCLR